MVRRFKLVPPLPPFFRACLTESLGSFFLVLIICMANVHAGKHMGIAIGFGLTSLIYSYDYVSRAQFNPALSVCLFVAGVQDIKSTCVFIILQVGFAICGALTASVLIQHIQDFPILAPYGGQSTIDDSSHVVRAFFSEFLFTFHLAITMVNVAVSKQKRNNYYGIAVGFALIAGIFCVGDISGASFNPAVTTALQIIPAFRDVPYPKDMPAAWMWLYWLAELAAGIFAGAIFHLLDIDHDLVEAETYETERPLEHDVTGLDERGPLLPTVQQVTIPRLNPYGTHTLIATG